MPLSANDLSGRRPQRAVLHSIRIVCAICWGCVLALPAWVEAADIPFKHVAIDLDGPSDMHTKTVGDLNGDGFLDLVVAGTKGQLVWYEYPGWKKHVIATDGGGWSTDAEVGDLDRDGDQDIVISDWYQNSRIVWFENPGRGEGMWRLHVIGEPKAHDIELVDLDRDGDLDVVTRQQGADGNTLEVWIQSARDAWTHRTVHCPVGEGLASADLDQDGDPDLIIGGRWYETPSDPAGEAWIEHVYTNAWKHPACVAKTGDFNNDGRVDIVLTPAEPKGNTYRIAWYEAPPNPKNAAWTEHTIDRPVETIVHALDVADMNGDGNLDVVVAEMHQGRDPDEVRVFINQGGGRDWTSQVVATTGSHGIRVVDIGNDGDFDIFGANWSASSQVDLWENRTDPERGDDQSVALDNWTYIHVDDTRTGRAFGLTMADLTGDGRSDIVSGKYFYRNPGGDLTGSWARTTFPIDVDGLLTLDVDGDSFGDVIALDKTGKLYWLEATTRSADSWNAVVVGDVGKADHGLSSQGFTLGQLVPGGRPEIIITVGGLFYFEIPDRPETARWPRSVIARQASEEGIDTGDMDGDGDLDICGGVQKGSGRIAWWENPGNGTSDWTRHDVGTLPDKYADRFYAADLDGDKRLDIVVSAANGTRNGVYWWGRASDPTGSPWIMHTVVVQATTNSMDVADMDRDGDIDIISGEHRGTEKVAVWENDGRGRFTEHVVSTGKESHLGTRVADLDGDGDLDIVSIAWDDPQHLHLWRNDAKVKHVPTPK